MANLSAILIPIAFTFVFGLLAIIYSTLSKTMNSNSDAITQIKEKYVTKEDFNRQNDKVDIKLDKIIDILMGVKKWKLKLFTY